MTTSAESSPRGSFLGFPLPPTAPETRRNNPLYTGPVSLSLTPARTHLAQPAKNTLLNRTKLIAEKVCTFVKENWKAVLLVGAAIAAGTTILALLLSGWGTGLGIVVACAAVGTIAGFTLSSIKAVGRDESYFASIDKFSSTEKLILGIAAGIFAPLLPIAAGFIAGNYLHHYASKQLKA